MTYDTEKTAEPDDYRAVKVTLTCTKELIDEDKVDFIVIAADMQGRDLLTFKCPECGETHKAYRLG